MNEIKRRMKSMNQCEWYQKSKNWATNQYEWYQK